MQDIVSFILSPPSGGWVLFFKIIALVLSLIFSAGILFFLFKSDWLKKIILEDLIEVLTYQPYQERKRKKAWAKIVRRLGAGIESEYKLAVIEADELLNKTLKEMGWSGKNLEDRLKQLTPATVANLDLLKKAHQVRNNIIQDPDYKLSLGEAKRTLDIYEQALKDLQFF